MEKQETKFLVFQTPNPNPDYKGPVRNAKDIEVRIIGLANTGKTLIGLKIAKLLQEEGFAKEVSLHCDTSPADMVKFMDQPLVNYLGGKINAVRVTEHYLSTRNVEAEPFGGRNWVVSRTTATLSKLPSEQFMNLDKDQAIKDGMDLGHHLAAAKVLTDRLHLDLKIEAVHKQLHIWGITQEEVNEHYTNGTWKEFQEKLMKETPKERQDRIYNRRKAKLDKEQRELEIDYARGLL